jgi:hypothetical protein
MLKGTSRSLARFLSFVSRHPQLKYSLAYLAIRVFPTPVGPSIIMLDFSIVTGFISSNGSSPKWFGGSGPLLESLKLTVGIWPGNSSACWRQ